jgi:TM2 domain-containing membrane protein YozV
MNNNSSKSYGVAVSLCGVFGILGIHHFYIGNILHGVFDLTLFILAASLLISDNSLGVAVLLVDIVHTILVFYKLITEKQKDGHGKLIVHNAQ